MSEELSKEERLDIFRQNRKEYKAKRRARIRKYNCLYTRIESRGKKCFYCEIKDKKMKLTKDHAFPLVELEKRIQEKRIIPGNMMYIVDCCRACNRVLGKHIFDTMEERKFFAKHNRRARSQRKKFVTLTTCQELDIKFPV